MLIASPTASTMYIHTLIMRLGLEFLVATLYSLVSSLLYVSVHAQVYYIEHRQYSFPLDILDFSLSAGRCH